MALLGNLLGTVDGLLGTATGALGDTGVGSSTETSASASADTSNTLDLGAIASTSPSVELSTPDLAGIGGLDASVSAPTMIGATADVGHLDVNGLLQGLV